MTGLLPAAFTLMPPHLWLFIAILVSGLAALATEVAQGEPMRRRIQIEGVTGALALLALWVATSPLTGGLLSLPLIGALRLSHHLMERTRRHLG